MYSEWATLVPADILWMTLGRLCTNMPTGHKCVLILTYTMALPLSKDDLVEIVATFSGSFILGASFAKELFMRGNFELRIFFFGLSSIFLLLVVAKIAKIKLRYFDVQKKLLSSGWILLFLLGTISAVNLFNYQFMDSKIDGSLQEEALFFILGYTLSTNALFFLNQEELEETLKRKTGYKYLIAPINGIGCGTILSWLLMLWTKNAQL